MQSEVYLFLRKSRAFCFFKKSSMVDEINNHYKLIVALFIAMCGWQEKIKKGLSSRIKTAVKTSTFVKSTNCRGTRIARTDSHC